MKQKIIVLGLGTFGGNLALKLTQDGHEVFGADLNPAKIEQLHHKIHFAIGMDTSNESAIQHMPLDDCDLVVIAIGEDVGASITTTALIKKHYQGRIIARSLNPIHKMVLEAMEIEEIIEPEAEYAIELANRIMVKGAIKSMELHGNYEIVEVQLPKKLIGKTMGEIDMKNKYNSYIITVIKQEDSKNLLGFKTNQQKVYGIMHSTYQFEQNDLLLVFGQKVYIDKFIDQFS
jgi:trk system potassium uptake protein TrkA